MPEVVQNMTLDLVEIDVLDWTKMAKFYQEVVGLEPLFLEPEHRYGWFKSGDFKVALRGIKNESEGPRRGALIFLVDNLRKRISEFEAQGITFHDKQLDTGEDYEVAYFRDPEGNSIGLWAPPQNNGG